MATQTTKLNLTVPSPADYVDVTVIASNFEKLDNLGVSYVTEVGTTTSGGYTWYYKNWSDNRYEAWGIKTGKVETKNTFESLLKYGNDRIEFPFAFSEKPVLTCTLDGGGLYWPMSQDLSTTGCVLHIVGATEEFEGSILVHISGMVG